MPLITHPKLIVGMENSDDAGVYQLTEELAIVQTIDFFTPIVDDPYTFGQIAVANALSDVYAMGAKPLTGMNVVCFPLGKMDIDILRDILRGGLDKMHEAGVLLVGGHSVDDSELKYGLSVTGIIHPKKVVRNRGALVGDKLILTKPLGTGIITTALKRGMAESSLIEKAVNAMTQLNKKAAELMSEAKSVHAATDITGFGLLGHAAAMIEGTNLGMVVYSSAVPFFQGVKELAEKGIMPGGLQRNKKFRLSMIESSCPAWLVDVLFDPQTSGGLLISLPPDEADKFLGKIHLGGITEASIIGEIVASERNMIQIT